MIRQLLRWLTPVVVVAVAWFCWWVWPERALKEWRVSACWQTSAHLTADGETVAYADDSGEPRIAPMADRDRMPSDRFRLMNLNDGRQLLPDELTFDAFTLDDGKLVALTRKDFRIEFFDKSDGRRFSSIPFAPNERRDRTGMSFGGSGALIPDADDPKVLGFWNVRTGQKHRNLPIDSRFRPDNSGGWLASRMGKNLRLLNLNDGREIQLPAPEAVSNAVELSVRPDGGALAAYSRATPGSPSKVLVYSVPDLKVIHELPISYNRGGPLMMVFSPNGRYLMNYKATTGALWDLHGERAVAIADADGMSNGSWIHFSPDDKSFVILMRGRAAPAPFEWILHHGDPPKRVAGNIDLGHAPSSYSRDGRWLAVTRIPTRQLPDWMDRTIQWLLAHFGKARSESETYLLDASNGRAVNRIPAGHFVGFAPDDTVWTQDLVQDPGTKKITMHLRQWPVAAPPIPAWLWLVTASGAGFVWWNVRRALRNRVAAKQASADAFPLHR